MPSSFAALASQRLKITHLERVRTSPCFMHIINICPFVAAISARRCPVPGAFHNGLVPLQCCLRGIEVTSRRRRCQSVLHFFGQAAMTEALATTPRVEYTELQRLFVSFDHRFYLFYLVSVYTILASNCDHL